MCNKKFNGNRKFEIKLFLSIFHILSFRLFNSGVCHMCE